MNALSTCLDKLPNRLNELSPLVYKGLLYRPNGAKAAVIALGGVAALSAMHSVALIVTAVAISAIMFLSVRVIAKLVDAQDAMNLANKIIVKDPQLLDEVDLALSNIRDDIIWINPCHRDEFLPQLMKLIRHDDQNNVKSWIVKNFVHLPPGHREGFISAAADLHLLEMQPFERHFIFSQVLDLDEEVTVEHMRNVATQLGKDQKEFSTLPSYVKFAWTLYLLTMPVKALLPPLTVDALAAVVSKTRNDLKMQSLMSGVLSEGFKNWVRI